MRAIVIVLLLASGAGGCAEDSQELAAAEHPGFSTDAWDDQMRERTLRQGEARRIYH